MITLAVGGNTVIGCIPLERVKFDEKDSLGSLSQISSWRISMVWQTRVLPRLNTNASPLTAS